VKQLLGIVIVGVAVGVVWIVLKWWQAKKLHTRDLGDGGIQKLFDKTIK
jgi:hypothetical protein